jgi:hypothetical protein
MWKLRGSDKPQQSATAGADYRPPSGGERPRHFAIGSDARAQLASALQQLEMSYPQTLARLGCG